jgi:hypothetical protein
MDNLLPLVVLSDTLLKPTLTTGLKPELIALPVGLVVAVVLDIELGPRNIPIHEITG